MRAADRLRARLGEAEVLDLAFLDQVLHRPRHVLDRHVRVDAVLIEEVDGVDPEPLERGLGHLLDVLGPAVRGRPTRLAVGVELEPELGGDHHLPAEGGQRFAHQLLVRERAVDLGGVEEGDAALDGRPDQRDHLLLVRGRAVAEAHAHAAEPEGRDLQAAVSQCALLHLPPRLTGAQYFERMYSIPAAIVFRHASSISGVNSESCLRAASTRQSSQVS